MEYNVQDVFFRPHHQDFIRISEIQTHGKDPHGKKVKLSDPIYFFEYLLNFKPQFRNYKKDIDNMVSFKRWIKQ